MRSLEIANILHEASQGEEGTLHWPCANVVFDLRIHIMDNAAAYFAPFDEVLKTKYCSSVATAASVVAFLFHSIVVKGSRETKHCARPLQGLLERLFFVF